jgi:hypothetical protein
MRRLPLRTLLAMFDTLPPETMPRHALRALCRDMRATTRGATLATFSERRVCRRLPPFFAACQRLFRLLCRMPIFFASAAAEDTFSLFDERQRCRRFSSMPRVSTPC